MTHIAFGKQDYESFKANDRPGPVHMLNLVRLRDVAAYEDGRRATGAEAYAAYGRLSAPVLTRVGGRIVWRGRMEQVMIGPPGEGWDLCFIAEYPSPGAFLEMLKDPEYREAMGHRQAGVSDSRLICMAPLPLGADFGNLE